MRHHRRSWWEQSGFGSCGRAERQEHYLSALINRACDRMLAARAGLSITQLHQRDDWHEPKNKGKTPK